MSTEKMSLAWVEARCTEDGDCLLWRMACNPGGQPKYSSKLPGGRTKTVQVRRVLWQSLNGPIPKKRYVTTTCGNVRCLNPEHMALATKAEIVSKASKNPITKAKRFIAGVKATREKLGKLDMEKARYIRSSGKTLKTMAEELGVSISLVSKVRLGTAWREVACSNPFAGLMSANDVPKKDKRPALRSGEFQQLAQALERRVA